MVKNFGGNKCKKIARKDTFTSNKKTRLKTHEGETYGITIKLLGNSQCHVLCNDSIIRLCMIRKKFTGKHKPNNLLKERTWVLIGLREWETSNDKMEKCDLLECYNDNDKDIIKKQSDLIVDILINEEKKIDGISDIVEDNILFTDEESQDEIDINDI